MRKLFRRLFFCHAGQAPVATASACRNAWDSRRLYQAMPPLPRDQAGEHAQTEGAAEMTIGLYFLIAFAIGFLGTIVVAICRAAHEFDNETGESCRKPHAK